jgi:competence protein ComEA
MKPLWAAAFGVVGGLLGAGLVLLLSSPPRGQAILLAPPPTPAPCLVHVSGAVQQPGVYSLPIGSRVQDAVEAAGGASPAGALELVNLAAAVQDGQKIAIPTRVPTRSALDPPPISSTGADPLSPVPLVMFPLNINNATAAELEQLPGIGPVTAEKIIAHREANGLFPDISAIQDVPGIGPATFEKLRDLIAVEGP